MHECGPLLRIDEWMLVSAGQKNAVHCPASEVGVVQGTRLNVQESAVITSPHSRESFFSSSYSACPQFRADNEYYKDATLFQGQLNKLQSTT